MSHRLRRFARRLLVLGVGVALLAASAGCRDRPADSSAADSQVKKAPPSVAIPSHRGANRYAAPRPAPRGPATRTVRDSTPTGPDASATDSALTAVPDSSLGSGSARDSTAATPPITTADATAAPDSDRIDE